MEIAELPACLTLLGHRGAGARAISRLLCSIPSPRAILAMDAAALRARGLGPDTVAVVQALGSRPAPECQRHADWLQAQGIRVCSIHDPDYPERLRGIPGPPPVLFLDGAIAALHHPHMAIVGSRRPTPCGRELAGAIAAELAGLGLGTVSGLAAGIDCAAHLGALQAGGTTVAVMGTGPDRVYPARNQALARRIVAEGGALLTEFPPGTHAEPANFPRRNRIVSGLGLGVLVVEAGLPSGSLLTAQHAAEQGREVMAVPGSVRSPVSRGCHELLRNGAALVECGADVVRALGDRFGAPAAVPRQLQLMQGAAGLSALEQQVLAATGFEDTAADTVVARTGLDAAVVGATLVMLELRGLVTGGPGGYVRA